MKKVIGIITGTILSIVMMFSVSIPAMATEAKTMTSVEQNTKEEVVLYLPLPNSNIESDAEIYNWFPDRVKLTITKETDRNGLQFCKVALINQGFIFDRCDVYGHVILYNTAGNVIGSRTIDEKKLIYGVARVHEIYPSAKTYARGSYSLRVSDGDVGTLYTGNF